MVSPALDQAEGDLPLQNFSRPPHLPRHRGNSAPKSIATNGSPGSMPGSSPNTASTSSPISEPSLAPSSAPSSVSNSALSENVSTASWLCTKGDYRDYIEALSVSNPSLKNGDPNNGPVPIRESGAKVVLLQSPATGLPDFQEVLLKPSNAEGLKTYLEGTSQEPEFRRIYIMEGLAKDSIAALGGHFFMDPTLFQRQERTCVWSNEFAPTSDSLPQPSLLDPERHVHLQYCELRSFDEDLSNVPAYCHKTNRHVGMTALRKGKMVAIMRRKVSWWFEKSGKNGWDMVILCDPQIRKFRATKKDNPSKDECKDLKSSVFQGGYNDFIPTPRHSRTEGEAFVKQGPTRESMLEDLKYYFQQQSSLLSKEEWDAPCAAAIFPKKIVAAHYLQLIDYIKVMLPSLEAAEKEQWKALQTISRRCGNYRDDIEDTLLSLGYPLSTSIKKRALNWKDCETDYRYIYFRLHVLKERVDNLMASMTGLASIAGNQQNLEEAKRVKRLNLLALLFIPLAYTSSLFSMQDEYAPNRSHFWVYWVCAIGVVLFTLAVTWAINRALTLNEQEEWKVGQPDVQAWFLAIVNRLKKPGQDLLRKFSTESGQSGQKEYV